MRVHVNALLLSLLAIGIDSCPFEQQLQRRLASSRDGYVDPPELSPDWDTTGSNIKVSTSLQFKAPEFIKLAKASGINKDFCYFTLQIFSVPPKNMKTDGSLSCDGTCVWDRNGVSISKEFFDEMSAQSTDAMNKAASKATAGDNPLLGAWNTGGQVFIGSACKQGFIPADYTAAGEPYPMCKYLPTTDTIHAGSAMVMQLTGKTSKGYEITEDNFVAFIKDWRKTQHASQMASKVFTQFGWGFSTLDKAGFFGKVVPCDEIPERWRTTVDMSKQYDRLASDKTKTAFKTLATDWGNLCSISAEDPDACVCKAKRDKTDQTKCKGYKTTTTPAPKQPASGGQGGDTKTNKEEDTSSAGGMGRMAGAVGVLAAVAGSVLLF